jgi:hypothetical protein
VPRGKAHRDQGYRLVIGFEPRKVSLEKAHRELSHRLEIGLRRGGKRKERKKKIKFLKGESAAAGKSAKGLTGGRPGPDQALSRAPGGVVPLKPPSSS